MSQRKELEKLLEGAKEEEKKKREEEVVFNITITKYDVELVAKTNGFIFTDGQEFWDLLALTLEKQTNLGDWMDSIEAAFEGMTNRYPSLVRVIESEETSDEPA